jgi:hypothetical protein
MTRLSLMTTGEDVKEDPPGSGVYDYENTVIELIRVIQSKWVIWVRVIRVIRVIRAIIELLGLLGLFGLLGLLGL